MKLSRQDLNSVLASTLGPRALARIIIALSLLSVLCYGIAGRVGLELEVWCYMVVLVGPFGCLFLSGMLLVAFFRTGKRSSLALSLGLLFGLGTFAVFVIFCSRTRPDESQGTDTIKMTMNI